LDVPFCKTETTARAFSIYAPKLWNSSPRYVRDTQEPELGMEPLCIGIVKRALKTFLFPMAFADVPDVA